VGSWLDLTAMALAENPTLDNYSGYVEDSGEGGGQLWQQLSQPLPLKYYQLHFTHAFVRGMNTFAENIVSDALQVRWTCESNTT